MRSPEEGRLALATAREAVERALHASGNDPSSPFRNRPHPASWDEPSGVFVTLRQREDDRLRGCVGFARAVYPLWAAIPHAAVAAALEDPRFPPVAAVELDGLVFEVSLLTPPERLPGAAESDLRAAIVVGRDGLAVERGRQSGLLLPQVAVEEGWSAEEFLRGVCQKAGLRADAWRDPATRVYRFSADIFSESSQRPTGRVAEPSLTPTAVARPAPRE